jgi:hypothetical protein
MLPLVCVNARVAGTPLTVNVAFPKNNLVVRTFALSITQSFEELESGKGENAQGH